MRSAAYSMGSLTSTSRTRPCSSSSWTSAGSYSVTPSGVVWLIGEIVSAGVRAGGLRAARMPTLERRALEQEHDRQDDHDEDGHRPEDIVEGHHVRLTQHELVELPHGHARAGGAREAPARGRCRRCRRYCGQRRSSPTPCWFS